MDKKKLIGTIIGVLAFIALIAGATFAFFAASATSNNIVVGNTAEANGISLTVTEVTSTNNGLIPVNFVTGTNDTIDQFADALGTSKGTKCVDSNGNDVCQIYSITVTNNNTTYAIRVIGTLTLEGSENMKWQLISSADSTTRASYATVVDEGTSGNITVGGNTGGTSTDKTSTSQLLSKSGSATYYVVVWLEETGSEQDDDAGKSYLGSVTFTAVDGNNNEGITATFGTGTSTNVPAPVSFATDSWETIKNAIKSGNTSAYTVGTTREITLKGFTNEETGSNGKYTIRVVNNSTPSECNTEGFSQTACGFVFEFVDIITEHAMNDTATNIGGWPASSMRTYLNNTIYESLPSELQSVIIDTTVVSGHGDDMGESNFTTTDKLYLLSAHEVWNDVSGYDSYDTAYDNTRQLDYYSDEEVTSEFYDAAIKKYNDSEIYWWMRSAYNYGSETFIVAEGDGYWSFSSADTANGVAPAFRIG